MSEAILIAEQRSRTGKGPAGRFRREGRVPAVVYGLGADSVSITVPEHELSRILTGGTGANTLITLKLDGDDQLALARQIQRHPVRGDLVHVDFIRVRADVAVTADIPIHLMGDAEGAKRGGLLEQSTFSVTVEAMPHALPPSIEHEISAMEMGDQLHVRDLRTSADVKILNDPDELIAQVVVPRGMETAEGAEAAEGEAGEAGEGAAEGEGGGEPESAE